MKNKKLTRFLVIATLLVWGFIFFKIAASLSAGEKPVSRSATQTGQPVAPAEVRDTFTLLSGYEDPFLKNRNQVRLVTLSAKKPVVLSQQPITHSPPVEPAVPIDSLLTYVGLITNKSYKKKVALLSLKGKAYLANEGETLDNIKIIQQQPDSLKVRYAGKIHWLKRSKL